MMNEPTSARRINPKLSASEANNSISQPKFVKVKSTADAHGRPFVTNVNIGAQEESKSDPAAKH